MSRHSCRRCDWRPDPEDTYGPVTVQAGQHADATGHQRCAVCSLSLELVEIQTCTACVANIRLQLDEIVTRYALLPTTIDSPAAIGTLSLMAAGSDGTAWRGPERERTALDTTPWRVPERLSHTNRQPWPHNPAEQPKHAATVTWVETQINDNHPTDAPSVAHELSRWEDAWRTDRHEPAADTADTVTGAVHYLTRRLGWAASHHQAFPDFADEVRQLHHQVTRATHLDNPMTVGVPCFDCGADLLRRNGEDHYACPRCRREYDDASYWLAVKANLEQGTSQEPA